MAAIGITHDRLGDVHLNFAREIAHLEMSPGDAIDVGCDILAHAGASHVLIHFSDGRAPVDCEITVGPQGTKIHRKGQR